MFSRRHIAIACVMGTSLLAGCISLPKSTPETVAKPAIPSADGIGDPNDPLPRLKAFLKGEGLATTPANMGEAARLVAVWDPHITFAPDSTRGGEPVPGLMGQVWIFGPDIKKPLEIDGEFIVGVWDQTPKASGGEAVLLEVWHIDRDSARKFRHPDLWGSCYTLFLPWQRYNVDLKQINIQVRFNGADGRNLVAPTQNLILDHSATLQRAAEKLGLRPDGSKDIKQPDVSALGSRPWPVSAPTK
jgi:hypothetical protein